MQLLRACCSSVSLRSGAAVRVLRGDCRLGLEALMAMGKSTSFTNTPFVCGVLL